MFSAVLRAIFGSKRERDIKNFQPIVEEINKLEAEISPLSDEALGKKTAEFRDRHEKGTGLDELLPEAFAVV
ncbi:MAG: hypothetical protein V1653_00930, partial [bacterium]